MGTFHPFPRLPAELRIQIWESTVEPRVVDVRVDRIFTVPGLPAKLHLFSRTRVPAVLQTCREARNQGLYEQAFTELAATDGTRRRYVWINFTIDVVSIERSYPDHYEAVAHKIQWLKFSTELPERNGYWRDFDLEVFDNVREIYVVCEDGLWAWHQAIENHSWPCGEENVFLIDSHDGRTIRGLEMDEIFDKEWADAPTREDDEHLPASVLIPFKVSWIAELPPGEHYHKAGGYQAVPAGTPPPSGVVGASRACSLETRGL